MGALMQKTEPHWLVEITVRSGIAVHPGEPRLVAYEEVLASNEPDAKLLGLAQFRGRAKYEPVMRRRLAMRQLTVEACCANSAVVVG